MRYLEKFGLRASLAGAFYAGVLGVVVIGGQAPDQPAVRGLEEWFKPGPVFQDRNGDGVIDYVAARILLGEAASASEVAAAANVAARLGFETSALDLPLGAGNRGGAAVIVGSGGLKRSGLSAADAGVTGLGPGEGIVSIVDVGGAQSVVIAGGGDAGTRAAAEVFAGRLPHVWEPGGPTLGAVADEMRSFLGERGAAVTAVSVPRVSVMSGATGLERLVAAVELSTAADVARARTALASLAPAGRAARASASRTASGQPRALSFAGVRAVRVRLSTPGASPVEVDVPRPDAPEQEPLPRRPGAGAKEALDLSTLYANEGLLGDSDNNLIPDRVDALLSPAGEGTEGTVDLAARIGLESAGLSIPIAVPADAVRTPESGPPLVLIGTEHPLVDRLAAAKRVDPQPLGPGEGLIQVVRKAFGETSAVIVTGGDGRGVARALKQMAERFPHVWARGKDHTTLDDIEEDVRLFLSGRSPAGQAATALYKLDLLARDLAGKALESAEVRVSIEKAADGFADFLRRDAAQKLKADQVTVAVEDRDVQKASPIFTDEFDVPWEVEEFWQVFRAKVVPAVKKGQPVVVEARLSEPPDQRAQIEQQARAELVRAGAAEAGTTVRVLSAYKQGFSWLYDVVRPAVAGKAIEQITIRFAEIGPPPEWPQQTLYVPTRWLLELFPIDEVLARELKLDLARIRFERAPLGSPAYEVIVTGPNGGEIFRQTFEPKLVLRTFFDQFPTYEQVRVTTGWIAATVAGRAVVDQRIVTDLERVWDRFQARTLKAVYDHVMVLHEGKPRPEDAPFFGELRIDFTLSEPNYRLGVDEEQISSIESLQEELYFAPLHFFDLLGRNARGQALDFPGRVIPVAHLGGDGKAGHVKIAFTGFSAPRPMVEVAYRERNGRTGKLTLDIPKVAVERPSALSAHVRDNRDGLARLDLRVKVDTEKDERAQLIRRARRDLVDQQILSAEQVRAIVNNLSRLRAAGLYQGALAYHNLGELRLAAGWEHDPNPATEVVASLESNGRPAPFPDIKKLLPPGYRYAGGPMVQWETPMPPTETYEVLAKMSTFKEATIYKTGESYLGQDIWTMDLMAPVEASHWSQAKATTFKPTIMYAAREDANEVSSTGHVLKLAEMLLTDPQVRKKLDKVNVVIHPMTNPDGAQLAYDLYKITPDFMLHPGYFGALGQKVALQEFETDSIQPEAKIRPKIWRTWLPDIFLNPHGYPQHEWVQLFSEYATLAVVRNRVVDRYWQLQGGWFMPSFNYIDDPRYPRHKAAAFQIRDKIADYINAAAEVKALNERAYARYRRYAFEWDDKTFRLDYTKGVLIYTAIKGTRPNPQAGQRGGFMSRYPDVTIWNGGTEAPDETAYGEWLKLVATAGLQWDKAILDYLVEGHHVVERRSEPFAGGVSFSLHRPRPPMQITTRTTGEGGLEP